jgi:hypothetical protein
MTCLCRKERCCPTRFCGRQTVAIRPLLIDLVVNANAIPGDRTGDIQLGELVAIPRSTQNQAFSAGLLAPGAGCITSAIRRITSTLNCWEGIPPHHYNLGHGHFH